MPTIEQHFFKMFAFHNEPLLLLPPRQCLTVHTVCFNMTLNSTLTGSDPTQALLWTDVVSYICYLLLPMVIFFCVLGQLVNIVILSSQVRLSLDTYLLGMSIAALLHVFTTTVLCAPYYLAYSEWLVHVQYYSLISREWFTHIYLWLLVSLSIERSVTFSIHKTFIPGTSSQTWIITGVVTCVGLVSVLPRLWEYTILALQHNSTSHVTIIYRTPVAEGAGFSIIYFWYLSSMFVILPVFLMVAACIILCQSAETDLSKTFDRKHSSHSVMASNRQIIEDKALTKLVIIIIVVNLVFTSPFIFFHIFAGVAPGIIQLDSAITITLQNIFTILYYINFILHQQLYFCFNKQYRITLLSICCCCC
ncbi:uncharacterized protein [Argopecten irradians]|uniref:uncharacterized protein n=1 Tax=Argopecten irradians TaxID=31199 RepID=UPI0037200DD3